MATRYAVEGSALDFSAAGTWGGGAPANGDDLIIGKGFYRFTSGLSLGSVNLDSLQISEEADVEIGLPGNPLIIDIDSAGAGLINLARRGFIYHSGARNVFVQQSQAKAYLSGGDADVMIVAMGSVYVGSACELADIRVLSEGDLEADSHASDIIAVLRNYGGNVVTRRNVVLGEVTDNGRLTFENAATISDGSGNGQLDINGVGARVRVIASSAITFDDVKIWSGTFDPTGSRAQITLTDSTLTAKSRLVESYGTFTIAKTNASTKYGPPGSRDQFAPVVPI